MSNSEYREAQQQAREHGLRARQETREARAIRRQVAEEIAHAIQAHRLTFNPNSTVATELYVAEEIARGIGAQQEASA